MIPDNCASSLAKTSLHTSSQTLQINTIIPLKSRKNFNVYLPAQGVFFLRVKRGHCAYVYTQNPRRIRYLIPQEAL